jgi:3-isopropylmalate/(R)-2-methylmalate dehydratase small subunit
MDKFVRLTATACPLDVANLNTDQLIPARYLKWPRSAGLGKVLLHDLRFDAEERERHDFPLNQRAWRDARIIVAGRNFGCGSSREAAVYALCDYGIRCVIAPSFADIFSGNAVHNGLLTAIVFDDEAAALIAMLAEQPDRPMTVDLEQQAIQCGERTFRFAIDPVRRARLLDGWDDIALTESYRDQVAAFKAADRARRPWAVPARPGPASQVHKQSNNPHLRDGS